MSYAQRPMGDYKTYGYAGDPGFLSSLWKGIKKVAAPIIGGILGGPVGAIVAQQAGRRGTPPILPPPPGTIGGGISFPGGTQVVGQYAPGLPAVVSRRAGAMPAGVAGACPSGYHLAKDGSGRWVRNRRMNVANPRALRKAMRRVQGFEKLAKRTIQFTRRVRIKK